MVERIIKDLFILLVFYWIRFCAAKIRQIIEISKFMTEKIHTGPSETAGWLIPICFLKNLRI